MTLWTTVSNHVAPANRQSSTYSLQQWQLFEGLWNGPESKRMLPQRAASSLIPSLPRSLPSSTQLFSSTAPTSTSHCSNVHMKAEGNLLKYNMCKHPQKKKEKEKSPREYSETVWNCMPAAASTLSLISQGSDSARPRRSAVIHQVTEDNEQWQVSR